MTEPLMTIDELAAWAGLSRETIQDWVAARKIPFTCLAGSSKIVRFDTHHRAAIVSMGEVAPEQPISPIRATHPPAGPSPNPRPAGPRATPKKTLTGSTA